MKTNLCLCILFLFAGTSAFAAKKKPPLPYDSLTPKTVDLVFKHLDEEQKKSAQSKPRALKLAYEALQAKKMDKARSLAASALSDPVLSDYAHWIMASAFLANAQSKQDAHAAEQAYSHFQTLQAGDPYSPFAHGISRFVAQSELLWGYGLSPSKESVRRFENAFERLTAANALYLIEPEHILAFANGCKKNPTELCEPWILRLTEHVDREADEYSEIAKLFPILEHRPSFQPVPTHASQPYHVPDLDYAAFDDAMASYDAEKWDDAASKYQKFLDEFPRSVFRYRVRYWLARALKLRSKDDEATKGFQSLQQDAPLTYYGLLSAFASQTPLDKFITATLPLAAERDPAMSAQDFYHLERAEKLIRAKAYDLASIELKDMKLRNVMSSPFVMYLAALNYRVQNFPTLYADLTELIQRDYPSIASSTGLDMIFPVLHLDTIKKYSLETELDPVVILSLIKQESAFDARAISGPGAAGLMQIMFFTATQTSPGISRDDLLDPDQNIKTGTHYLAKLLSRYKGNFVLALAAYNAGPNAVDRWVKDGVKQKLGMLPFIESIPYKETREYVGSIIRNYFWYSKKLGRDLPRSLAFFWKPYSELNLAVGGPDVPASYFNAP
jgi:soluble lytic murein transglycosylase-like protein